MAKPFVESDAAEARFAQRHERALFDPAAEIPGLGIAHDLAWVANAARLDAIFWIEKVADPSGGPIPFIQLQYVQRVILSFPPAAGAPIIQWPHISVATLVKTL